MWKSVIDNPNLKKSIEKKIEEIARILNSKHLYDNEESGLLNGPPGILLFQTYYGIYSNSTNMESIENSILNAFSDVNKNAKLNLSYGLAGTLWVFNHLLGLEIIDLDDDIFKDTCDIIHNDLIRQSNLNDYDYLHGAFGHLLYLTERKDILNTEIIKNLFQKFNETSEFDDNKMFRKTILNSETMESGYCLGLAHGVPGIILILIKYLTLFPQDDMAKEILIKNLNYLRAAKKEIPDPYYFPTHIMNGKSSIGKLGWCYGDLGCALAILKAGSLLKRDDLIEEAISIFMYLTTCRGVKEQYITDADFCHGTVGIAHFFNRLYNSTGIYEFKSAAEYWYSQTLDLAKFSDGLAGFKHYNGLKKDFVCHKGLLEGIAGIGLSLISSISSIEPKWDRSLLLD